MEPLTWTGPLGQFLDPALYLLSAVFLVAVVVQIVLGIATGGSRVVTNPDGTLSSAGGAYDLSANATRWLGLGLLVVVLAYVVIGIFGGPQVAGIIGGMSQQLTPVWIALILTFALSIKFKRKLGLYGKLFDSTVGMIGFALVMFWVYAGIMAGLFDWIATHDSLSQVSGMKNKVPAHRCVVPKMALMHGIFWAVITSHAMCSAGCSKGLGWWYRSRLWPRCLPLWSGSRWACLPGFTVVASTHCCLSLRT